MRKTLAALLALAGLLAAAECLGTVAEAPAAPAPAQGPPAEPETVQVPIEELWERGEALFEGGDTVAALQLFEAALARDRMRARSWNYVGGVYFTRGDLSRALEHFRRAVELDPRDVRALNNLATAYERLGEHARAEEFYLRAASVDPSHAPTQFNLGILYAHRLGLPEAARRAWERYLELEPAGPDAERVRRELGALPPPAPAGAAAPPPATPAR